MTGSVAPVSSSAVTPASTGLIASPNKPVPGPDQAQAGGSASVADPGRIAEAVPVVELDPAVEPDVLALPKAHLHLHFTGSMTVPLLTRMAASHGIHLHRELLDGHPLRVPANRRGWYRFQRLYDMARRCVRTEADLRAIIDEAARVDAAEGVMILEMQVTPNSYAPIMGGITPALEVMLDEARLASQRHHIAVGIIVAAARTAHPLEARTLARLAARYAGDEPGTVVAFGLSNDERTGDIADFVPAFRIAARAGLPLVPHSGELLGADQVGRVLDLIEPRRLGHGVRAIEDPAVVRRIIERGITLEVCPASNVGLGVYASKRQVPVRRLFDVGARVALGADDPLLFGERLARQYEDARHIHGFTDAQLARLARYSIEGSVMNTRVKHAALARLDEWENMR